MQEGKCNMARKSSSVPSETKRQHSISTNLVDKSVGYLNTVLQDEKVPAATRLAAARTVLELAGMLGSGRKASGDREPHEMSDDELRQSIARRQAALASRAKPVDKVPKSDHETAKLWKELG
jgi:hypothetical protein